MHEVTSPQAFEGLRMAGRRRARRTKRLLWPTTIFRPRTVRAVGVEDLESKLQIETLEANCAEFGIEYLAMDDIRQGIVHVAGPEQGFTCRG